MGLPSFANDRNSISILKGMSQIMADMIPESLSFVMAGYNEEKNLEKAVRIVSETLEKSFTDYEIILVDDGSKDKTLSIMKKCAAELPRVRVLENIVNLNYGAAVLRGLKAAEKEWVVYDACDLEMNPADFVEHFRKMDKSLDVVVYERETYEAVLWRRFASLLNKLALNVLFPKLMRGTPTLNHVQMFRRGCVDEIIPLSRSPIFFSPEMIFRAKLKGMKWSNEKIPFHSIDGVRGGAFGHAYDIIWALNDMFRFRFRLWSKKI